MHLVHVLTCFLNSGIRHDNGSENIIYIDFIFMHSTHLLYPMFHNNQNRLYY